MIKANELIINRYFELNGLTVRAIDFDGLNSLYKDIKYLKPIPLNEEWLLKFGFEERKESDNFSKWWNGENNITMDWLFVIKQFKDENKFFFQNGYHIIKNIHQLQNLYFALTNQELEIKEL